MLEIANRALLRGTLILVSIGCSVCMAGSSKLDDLVFAMRIFIWMQSFGATRPHSSVFSGEMLLKPGWARHHGRHRILSALLIALFLSLRAFAQNSQAEAVPFTPQSNTTVNGSQSESPFAEEPLTGNLAGFQGLPVRSIRFDGINPARLDPLPDRLAALNGSPLTRLLLTRSLRQVYGSGLFDNVEVDAVRQGDGVALLFKGTPRTFIGTVGVDGAKGATINTQLQRASRLQAGTRFTQSQLDAAEDRMRQVLGDNGFHEPVIQHKLTLHPNDQLVDIAFHVNSGLQAHIGEVKITGDSGISVETFRHDAHLSSGARVDHDTVSRALNGVLKHYQKQNRLEADVKLESQNYLPATKRINYQFSAVRGPVVRVRVEGAGLDQGRIKRAIPIYEEGTVDDDLLNEGNRRLRDYYQRLGYFDVKVDHQTQTANANEVLIVFTVTLGARRRVERVNISGNHYFDTATLKDLLTVHPADTLDRHGLYSQALVAADIGALQAVYQNNGFSAVKVTSQPTSVEATANAQANNPASRKPAGIAVDFHVDEGPQQRVGTVTLLGNEHVPTAPLLKLMNTAAGQLLSPQNLADDRNAILTEYLGRGFNLVRVDVDQKNDPAHPDLVNVAFHITEGQQVFVRNVLVSGLVTTHPEAVQSAITLHPGDPLSQTALADTQRNLYDFALFNEVDTAVQNPNGGETQKTVLVQLTEARRWTLTYGIGFEAQTGTPQNNCAGYIFTGTACSPNGKTGISPRVLADLTRNGLFGREESASIQGTYGLLEQKVDLVFQNPHFYGNPNFGLNFTGGYANSQDVTTYVASKLDAGLRWTEHFNSANRVFSRANTFVYEFDFRRVKVAASSLQVFPTEIPLLSSAVRVAGPGLTWLRDTRYPTPLDAHRGTYTSFQEFFSNHAFGSEAQFNRLDVSNSSFYSFDKDRLVIARNTRYAQERAFGNPADELIPLPERIYSGGPNALRGFSINAAGPRDPETGFPIGGAGALVNSTEFRLPPPMLPFFGDSLSLVLFHDMGNVFANAGDAWVSALRIHQPDRDACKVPTPGSVGNPPTPNTQPTSIGPLGNCSFNYFSHAAGLGLRYHTPVGPIRLDFSYNLNPPIYPINVNYSQSNPYLNQHVGEAGHFNFFFSLGQTF
jgi:outer membrane protein insertion porin family